MASKEYNRRTFLKTTAAGTTGLLFSNLLSAKPAQTNAPNIMLITADDMNWDTPGCYGGNLNVTPNIDGLASQGMRFDHAHVQIAVCMPSRSVLMTGMYPHSNGAMGFQPVNEQVPTLPEILSRAGYYNGILGKVSHLKPREKFHWSYVKEQNELGVGRNPGLYEKCTRESIQNARNAHRPFFLMVNAHDPHRPYSGSKREANIYGERMDAYPDPSHTYAPDEVTVPEYLPDLPEVRQELAWYLNSSRRCDDVVGKILNVLEEENVADNTLVMFLSDNGIAMPFAKTNCYLHSTKTPWIVRWPDKIKPGTVDDVHMISGIDYMPTILEAAGIEIPEHIDGRSFLPVLRGKRQDGRDKVFTVFHETWGENQYQMRCLQTKEYGYIFNAWADGENRFKNGVSQVSLAMEAMEEAAKTDADIRERVELFYYRTPEELYNFQTDPHALKNLVDSPAAQNHLTRLRRTLFEWMEDKNDPLLPLTMDVDTGGNGDVPKSTYLHAKKDDHILEFGLPQSGMCLVTLKNGQTQKADTLFHGMLPPGRFSMEIPDEKGTDQRVTLRYNDESRTISY